MKNVNHLKLILKSTFSIIVFCVGSNASHAQFVGGISTNPSGVEKIGYDQASQISIRWTGQSDSRGMSTPNSNYSIRSSQGIFINDAGATILTVNRAISESIFGTGLNITDFSLRESLRIPVSLKRYMQQNNLDRVTYQRTFIDNSNVGAPDSATAQLIFELSNQGSFSVSGAELRFENRQLNDVVEVDEIQRAVLRLQHQGSGRLRLVWELATPASSAGTKLYRQLKTETISLTGKGDKSFVSPTLPTVIMGGYEVRARVFDSNNEVALAALSYRVIQGQRILDELKAFTPPDDSRINSQTPFSWASHAGAKAYRLEIVRNRQSDLPSYLSDAADSDQIEFVTGMLVTPDKSQTQLTGLVMDRIKSGEVYHWRVVAIGQSGQHEAASQWRSISLSQGTQR